MNAAVVKLAEAAEKGPRARGGREPLKVLGKHPRTEAEIKLMEGRYGAYVTDGTTNATLPKSIEKEALTLAEADRKSGVEGKRVSVSVDIGGRRVHKKKK